MNHSWNQIFCSSGVCELNFIVRASSKTYIYLNIKSTIDSKCAEEIYNVNGVLVYIL